MNNFVKIAAVLAAGAFLFKDQIADLIDGGNPIAVPPATPPPAHPATPPPAPATPPPYTPPPAAPATPPPYTPPPQAPPPAAAPGAPNFSQYIANTIGAGRHQMPADSWNWYYTQWSGVQQTADLFDPANRGAQISLTEYLTRREAAGLRGVRPIGRFDPLQAWS